MYIIYIYIYISNVFLCLILSYSIVTVLSCLSFHLFSVSLSWIYTFLYWTLLCGDLTKYCRYFQAIQQEQLSECILLTNNIWKFYVCCALFVWLRILQLQKCKIPHKMGFLVITIIDNHWWSFSSGGLRNVVSSFHCHCSQFYSLLRSNRSIGKLLVLDRSTWNWMQIISIR